MLAERISIAVINSHGQTQNAADETLSALTRSSVPIVSGRGFLLVPALVNSHDNAPVGGYYSGSRFLSERTEVAVESSRPASHSPDLRRPAVRRRLPR
jgi:hypothetical protein